MVLAHHKRVQFLSDTSLSASCPSDSLSLDGSTVEKSQEEEDDEEEEGYSESTSNSVSPLACSSGCDSPDGELGLACDSVSTTVPPRLVRSATSDRLATALHGQKTEELRSKPGICKVLAGPALALIVLSLHFCIFRIGDAFDGRNWWRCMAVCLVVWVPLTALTMSVNLAQWAHVDLHLLHVVPSTIIIGGIVFVSVWLSLSFLGKDWSYQPMPFMGQLSATMAAWAMACYGWFAVPADHRSLPDVRQRLKATTIFNSMLLICVLAYDIVFEVCALLWKPLTVFAFSGLHFVLNEVLAMLMHRVDMSDTKKFVGFYFVHTLHLIFLVTYIVSAPSWAASAVAAIMDLIMNLKYLLVIAMGQPLHTMLINRASPSVSRILGCIACALGLDDEAETEEEQDFVRMTAGSRMVVTETNEILQPLLYFAVVSLIYHGRNADDMAGIGASEFGEHALQGTWQLWDRIAMVVALDVFTCIMTTVAMRSIKLDLFDFFLAEVESHWLPIALLQTWVLDTVLCEEAIGCFVDFSFEFAW
eukprot:CAMPEP_0115241430 /NCGR_PEP_ID=MMETSP0270-20121206/38424_1 /TAXON_ID=71861 /ORGANISM="Scrippsiella trochoidea, Strain CCMP3099" /LENGTH=531 /DNA_ID=CAMNT_0002656447 /DNA_START=51 /DNA_END=1643 /DNA_ORIENTATION=+